MEQECLRTNSKDAMRLGQMMLGIRQYFLEYSTKLHTSQTTHVF